MDLDLEYIKQLTRCELSGNILPEEKAYLDNIVATNEDARRVYSILKSQFPEEKLEEISQSIMDTFLEVNPAFKFKKRYKVILYLVSIAGAAAVIIGMSLFISGKKNQRLNEKLIGTKSNAIGVELKLASGESFNLSKQTGAISLGKAFLHNSNKNLSVLSSTNAVQIAILNVPNGMDYKVQLEDGSFVHLNAGSSLRFPLSFSDDKREISISGEAYISVKEDVAKPFFVHFDHVEVQVLGTEFNINAYNAEAKKIALVSGSVRIVSSEKNLVLKPGLEALIGRQDQIGVGKFDSNDVLSWRKGEYPFVDVTLSELGQLIERYYGIDVQIESSSAIKKFTGVISKKTPIENFLAGLELTGFIKYYKVDKNGSLIVEN